MFSVSHRMPVDVILLFMSRIIDKLLENIRKLLENIYCKIPSESQKK